MDIIDKLTNDIKREETVNKLIEHIESKAKKNFPGQSFILAVNDAINEFLIYTNRDEVPELAYGLIENMALKRYYAMEDFVAEDTEDKIKSYSQGNISITYKDNIQKDYELSDSEKAMMDKFVISKATRLIKRRKQ